MTLASMFSGPIASVSSRSSHTVQKSTIEVLRTVRFPGSSANLEDAEVLWNSTIKSLDQASFPNDQLLDFLPSSDLNWTYVKSEWNPTWTAMCNFTDETVLPNVTGSGNTSFHDPINAFPVYRETYDPSWLNKSQYRYDSVFDSFGAGSEENSPFTDVLFFVTLQSDPQSMIDGTRTTRR
jgi:hypothetical protein